MVPGDLARYAGDGASALLEAAEAGVWPVHRDVAAEPPRLVLELPQSDVVGPPKTSIDLSVSSSVKRSKPGPASAMN